MEVILRQSYRRDVKPTFQKVTFAQAVKAFDYDLDKTIPFDLVLPNTCAEKFAQDLVQNIMFQVTKPLDNKLIQEYMDSLFLSIIRSLDDHSMRNSMLQQVHLENYADKLASEIAVGSLTAALPSLNEARKIQKFNEYADNLVNGILSEVVEVCDSGLTDYCDRIVADAVHAAVISAPRRKCIEEVATLYAEKLSLRVFRDFFIHLITDANNLAYHMLGSYEAVSKNLIDTFAQHITDQIMTEIIPKENKAVEDTESDLLDWYSNNLARDIIETAEESVLDRIVTPKQQESSKITVETAEFYASQIMQNLVWETPCYASHSKTSSTSSQPGCSYECYDAGSESVTPRSATDEIVWKRGLYHFADQLLYSLSVLENDRTSPGFFFTTEHDVAKSRVRRSGSCPHIQRKPILKSKDNSGLRRQSETVVRFRISVVNYAEDLASKIIQSTLNS
ncbi:unnamed protein product [Clavelina lepadiformis]|uniref:Uncharacterized protein n=1 Tax=Clavelina lepadiformis TaxID=159417 RepID=A0ABP0FWP9_CLALP